MQKSKRWSLSTYVRPPLNWLYSSSNYRTPNPIQTLAEFYELFHVENHLAFDKNVEAAQNSINFREIKFLRTCITSPTRLAEEKTGTPERKEKFKHVH
ncbi:hypothetical protein TNCV_4917651 [Trichonephila clavipes]|nr:hypothetical protein TNCV_4917651 [Trichonephila clavipes]